MAGSILGWHRVPGEVSGWAGTGAWGHWQNCCAWWCPQHLHKSIIRFPPYRSAQGGKLYLYRRQIVNVLGFMGQRITHASYLRHWALQLEVKVASVESSMSWPSGCGLQTPGLPAGIFSRFLAWPVKTPLASEDSPPSALVCVHSLKDCHSFQKAAWPLLCLVPSSGDAQRTHQSHQP